jgi:hypothetical protein
MLARRVANLSIPQIAKEFNVSPRTVQYSLAYAVREGLTKAFETDIVTKLVPLALQVYKEKLENDRDPYIAKDVIDKLVKLGDRFSQREGQQEEQDLKAYIESRREQRDKQKIVDGVVVKVEKPAVGMISAIGETTNDRDSGNPADGDAAVTESPEERATFDALAPYISELSATSIITPLGEAGSEPDSGENGLSE